MGIEFYDGQFVSADETRNHLEFLRSRGLGLQSIAERANSTKSTLQRIATGKTKLVAKKTERQVLAVPAIQYKAGAYVSTEPIRKMIADLKCRGFSEQDIAAKCGYGRRSLGLKNQVRLYKFQRIQKVCHELIRTTND